MICDLELYLILDYWVTVNITAAKIGQISARYFSKNLLWWYCRVSCNCTYDRCYLDIVLLGMMFCISLKKIGEQFATVDILTIEAAWETGKLLWFFLVIFYVFPIFFLYMIARIA